jgi:hypothetical protein
MARDPREDPRPGDAIEIACGWLRVVVDREFAEFVTYQEKRGRTTKNTPERDKTVPIDEWRREVKNTFVLSRSMAVK